MSANDENPGKDTPTPDPWYGGDVQPRASVLGNDTAPRPWYRRKRVYILGFLLLVAAVKIVTYIREYKNFHHPIQVTREPWQVLDPGKPVEPLKFEVVEEGTGEVVEPGDLIQVSVWWWSPEEKQLKWSKDWWIWVGFRTEQETVFYASHPRFRSAFVGQRGGWGVKFLEPSRYIVEKGGGIRFLESSNDIVEKGMKIFESPDAGTVSTNPFGSYSNYRKPGSASRGISIPYPDGRYNVVRIEKVFKGELRYRSTRLYDDTWFRDCRWFWTCEIVKTPRVSWCDDARYDGVSADGKRATFQYGPVNTFGITTRCGMKGWPQNEWEKLPLGVQVE